MKTALVLSGGGAKGAFQVGVLKKLTEEGYKFDALYGTSVGALNSAGLSYLGFEGVLKIWNNIKKMSDIFKLNWWKLGPIFGDGMYSYKPLQKLLNSALEGKSPQIRTTVTKVNVETGELWYVRSDSPDFKESVLASTLVPMAADPLNGIWYDGGVREISPLKQAIKDGADKIVIILCSPWQPNPEPWKRPKWAFLRGLKLSLRAVDIVAHEIFVNDVKVCARKNEQEGYKKIEIELYAPPVLVTGTNEFNQKHIQAAIAQGYEVAAKGPIKIT